MIKKTKPAARTKPVPLYQLRVDLDGAEPAVWRRLLEDCGGIGGYAELLRIIRSPKHKEYTTMRTWLGGPFDPLTFNMAHTNKWLQKLKRPCMSEAQLARVLAARDHETLRHRR